MIPTGRAPVLLPEDLRSPTWLKIKAHFEERLADHRKANDNDKDAVATAKLRGRIAEAQYLLDLAKPPEPLVAPPYE